jgi:Kef-type K+ transport system membrane component KefB
MAVESTVPALLLILLFGLIIPDLFKKAKLPFFTSLILIGSVFGPFGFGLVQIDNVIEFFGFLGAAFLMLLAGLEVKLEHLEKVGKKILLMAALNGILPFIAGYAVMAALGYNWLTAMLVGTIFISSSVAVIIGTIKSAHFFDSEVGKTVISMVVIEDIFSLLVLAMILQGVSPVTAFPLPIYFVILIASVFLLKKFIPVIAEYFFRHIYRKHDQYEMELRFILVILMTVLLYFAGLGVHPIVAAFVVGLILSDIIKTEEIHTKLHTIGYGLFVPVFFFIVGMDLDLGLLFTFELTNIVMISVILASLGSKFISGYIAGRATGMSKKNSSILGIATTPQLTTTLAVVYAVATLNILDELVVSTVIILSVLTTVLSPFLLNIITHRPNGKAGGKKAK